MDKQLTKEEAIGIYDSQVWKDWNAEEIVKLQLFQECLCVPFGVFHEAVESVLGRPVWTHEFAFADRLREEYLGNHPMPSFEEICALIPADRLIVCCVGDAQ